MTTIETILKQHGIGGFDGEPKSVILSHLYLGESEMRHNADKYPRDAAHYQKEAARYSNAAKAINELEIAA